MCATKYIVLFASFLNFNDQFIIADVNIAHTAWFLYDCIKYKWEKF